MRFQDIVFVYHLKDESQMRWHGRSHAHPHGSFELHYFVSGSGSFRNGQARYNIAPGSLFLSKPGTTHQIVATDVRRPITYYALLFSLEDGDNELLALLEKRIFTDGDRLGLGTSWRFFFADLREKAMSGNGDLIASAGHQFLSFLYALAGGDRSAYAGGSESAHIEKAIAYMQGNLERKLNLAALAQRLELSREHLVRVFTSRMRISPMRYFAQLKVEAAQAMLSSTNYRVGEIADRLGFESQFHFARTFSARAGMSPTEFRRRCLQKADFRVGKEDAVSREDSGALEGYARLDAPVGRAKNSVRPGNEGEA
jgi:AraC-like DNA-binding protein